MTLADNGGGDRGQSECEASAGDSGSYLVLRLSVEIAGLVALMQLARRIAVGAVDLTTALDGGPLQQFVSPAVDVLVILHAEELAAAIEPAFDRAIHTTGR